MKLLPSGLLCVMLGMALGCEGGGTPGNLTALDLSNPGADAVETDTAGSEADTPLPDGAICRPGEAKCMGSIFLVCNVAGADWMSVTCPEGQACTPTGCEAGAGEDVIVGDDAVGVDTTPPLEDVVQPPVDILDPVDVPQVVDLIEPSDSGPVTDPGVPANCGNNPPCASDRECCDTVMGLRCVPRGQCAATQGCQSAQDCGGGQQCCPGQYPGAPSQCAASCGGTGNQPTCQDTTDCSGGQTCVDLMITKYCLSQCATDGDCDGQACQDIGAMGYTLASVCACAQDTDCDSPLLCCDIPYLGGKTCMSQCM